MSYFGVLLGFIGILGCTQNVYPNPTISTYFPNWAQYNANPYAFTPQKIAPIVSKLNVINYAFAYFCPSNSMYQPYWVKPPYSVCNGKQAFQITNIEYNDNQMYKEIINYKKTNPNLKILISVGGWNFPSNFFSVMVSNKTSRTVFIDSVVAYMKEYGFDGLDIDWEYPKLIQYNIYKYIHSNNISLTILIYIFDNNIAHQIEPMKLRLVVLNLERKSMREEVLMIRIIYYYWFKN